MRRRHYQCAGQKTLSCKVVGYEKNSQRSEFKSQSNAINLIKKQSSHRIIRFKGLSKHIVKAKQKIKNSRILEDKYRIT